MNEEEFIPSSKVNFHMQSKKMKGNTPRKFKDPRLVKKGYDRLAMVRAANESAKQFIAMKKNLRKTFADRPLAMRNHARA